MYVYVYKLLCVCRPVWTLAKSRRGNVCPHDISFANICSANEESGDLFQRRVGQCVYTFTIMFPSLSVFFLGHFFHSLPTLTDNSVFWNVMLVNLVFNRRKIVLGPAMKCSLSLVLGRGLDLDDLKFFLLCGILLYRKCQSCNRRKGLKCRL